MRFIPNYSNFDNDITYGYKQGEDKPFKVCCASNFYPHMAEGSDGKRTKHIDIRYHFVRKYVEDGIMKAPVMILM